MISSILNEMNPIIWIASNVILFYITFVLLVFVVSYRLLFNHKATTAGRWIWRFAFSLLLMTGLIDTAILLDPGVDTSWIHFPGRRSVWYPILRFAVFLYVAYVATMLTIVLGIRRYKPEIINTKPDFDLIAPKTDSIPEVSNDDAKNSR